MSDRGIVFAVALLAGLGALQPSVHAQVLDAPIAATRDEPNFAVLDAGDFLAVEARHATVAEAIDALASRLNLKVSNVEALGLSGRVDGAKRGDLKDILSWISPDVGFVITYEESRGSDPRRATAVTFGGMRSASSGSSTPGPAAVPLAPQPQVSSSSPAPSQRATPRQAAGEPSSAPTSDVGKPEIADTGGQPDDLNVAQHLYATSVASQLSLEQSAHDVTGQAATPPFLNGPGNSANSTIPQQMQRAQALATGQMRALRNALSTVCGGQAAC